MNHKGGVGKTTTAINLAHALVLLGKKQNKDYRVLVVDSDPQANATSVLFPKGQDISSVPTLADVYNEREPFPIIQVITPTSVPGLGLIPSSIGMFDVEPLVNSTQALRKAMLDDALLELTADGPNYDMVLIDTPPNLGIFLLNSLVSNFYLIPIDCGSYFALEGMQTLESKIQQIKELHRDLQLVGYLPIRLDNRTQVGHIALTRLREFYGETLWTPHPHQYGFREGGICQTDDIRLQGFGKRCRGLQARSLTGEIASQVRRGSENRPSKTDPLKRLFKNEL